MSPAVAQADGGPVDLGAFDATARFMAGDDGVFAVTGELDGRPQGGTYPDTLEFRAVTGDGLTVINDVSLAAYVEGIAEVPVRWPIEALKAQAVAARTYAWYSQTLGSFADRGYDICATVSCQVYAGREHAEAPGGERWQNAVASTAGEVLVHDGAPILARYFSTSGGRTRSNEEVYPDEGPRPYLKGVPDPEDAVSPYHEWQVSFTRAAMNAILAEGEQLSATVPFASLEHVRGGEGETDRVRAVGQDGTEVVVGASVFRSFVSAVAPDLYPDRYPGRTSTGQRLPQTLPSSRFEVTVGDEEVVVDGRGFGHGVGMSQYGAMGKALAGMTYDDILAAYYGGLRPATTAATPDRIRVGLATEATRIMLRPQSPARLLVGDRTVTERAMGTWTVVPGPGRSVRIVAPAGYGAPLVVSATAVSDAAPAEVEVIELEAAVNKPAELFLTVTAGGDTVVDRSFGVFDAGRQSLTWDLDADDGQLPAGSYTVSVRAVDETGTGAGDATDVEIRRVTDGGSMPGILGAPPAVTGRLPWGLLGAVVTGALLGVVVAARVTRERRP